LKCWICKQHFTKILRKR